MLMDNTIHLVVSDLFPGDAIGNFVLAVRDMLRRKGFPASLHAERFASDISGVQPYAAFFEQVQPKDVLFYQLSNYDPVWPMLMAAPCRRVVYYHNITPSKYFAPYAPETARLLDAGRAALPLAASAHAVLANSRYSLAELEPFLPQEVPRMVFPPFLEEQLLSLRQKYKAISAENSPYLLMLGRVVPHKRIEDGLTIFARVWAEFPTLRLLVAGGFFEPYMEDLRRRVAADPVLEKVVTFTGALSANEVRDLLHGASGLLHTSVHEGFCLPLLEAMLARVPVFATQHAAVPETLGGAGVPVDSDNPNEAATHILHLLHDQKARTAVVEAQTRRAGTLLASAQSESLTAFLTGRNVS
jgi:glycosyltransferase involved in cell wall biosynthesis